VIYNYCQDEPILKPRIGWNFELVKKLVKEINGVEKINNGKEKASNEKSKCAKNRWWKFGNKLSQRIK